MTQTEIAATLAAHAAWARGEAGGQRANLAGANLARANLAGANLARANLAGAWLVSAGPVGAAHRTIVGSTDGRAITIRAGCFTGSPTALRRAIRERYADGTARGHHRAAYLAAVAYVVAGIRAMRIEPWSEEKRAAFVASFAARKEGA